MLDERTVRFRFKQPNRELPLVVGAIPVFSRDWGMENGKPKPFDQVVTDTPIGSGPYRIGPVRFGKDITYVRDPDYWGRDLPARVGTANFDRISVKIYRDNTAKLEALKAGEFDLMRFTAPATGRGACTASASTGASWSRANSATSCPRGSRAMCSTPGALCCRTCAFAVRWTWPWTTNG